ncbi:MAG TPA: HEAT repeat domain-containing protein [Planctomycetes bacterium]|nr:HEAT repeat domain-containing protein [Planctomycetota bacterium]
MKSLSRRKNFSLLGALAGCLLGAACASSGTRPVPRPPRPVLEKRGLPREAQQGLIEVEQAFLREDPRFVGDKARLLQRFPEAGPWLAKAFITHAVLGHDALLARGFFPEALIHEGKFGGKLEHSLFARARVALVSLGATGARSIRVYLLRDTKGPNRLVGRLLLEAFPPSVLYPQLQKEFAQGPKVSKREILHLLGDLPPSPKAVDLLEKALRSPSWELRGAALVPLAKQWKKGGYRGGRARLQSILAKDPDPFVRRKAVQALALLGDPAAGPDLLRALERGFADKDSLMVETASAALKQLTGQPFGSKVEAWRTWFKRRGQ